MMHIPDSQHDRSRKTLVRAASHHLPRPDVTIKILLVDDNRTFVAAVRQFLGAMPGAEVIGEAYDGHEALVQARQLQPDLVLLDINMPLINGLDVARRLLAL